MPTRILIVEDDPDIAELVGRYLDKAGFVTERAGVRTRRAARRSPRVRPDLMVLDLMLPHVDGLEVCRHDPRQRATAAIPIIMLTARAEESERIVGLELGADDYLAKPFSPNELVARVRALLRRAARGAPSTATRTLAYGPIAVDTERHIVSSDGRDVTLTAKEFLLLEYLLQHRGRVLSRDVLLTDVWGYRYTGGTRTVDVHVRRLREKLPLLADGAGHRQAVRLQARRSDTRGNDARADPGSRPLPDQAVPRGAVRVAPRARRRRRAVRDDDAAADRRADRADAGGRSAAGRRSARPAASQPTTGRRSSTSKPTASARLLGARVTFIAPDGGVVGDSSETLDGVAAMENHGAAARSARGRRAAASGARSATATR